MAADIYDPLTEYVNVFRGRFREVAKNTFAKLAEEAKVNVEANRATCRQLYSLEDSISELKSSIRKWNALSILLWVVFGVGVPSPSWNTAICPHKPLWPSLLEWVQCCCCNYSG